MDNNVERQDNCQDLVVVLESKEIYYQLMI